MNPPVNPNADASARRLLAYLYAMQGKHTISGQHNQLHKMSFASDEVARISGHYPALWGGEWGFSDERHNVDNIAFRPALLAEIKAQHQAGRIIVMSYHQANPAVGEPCGFEDGVLGNLTSEQWDGLFDPGSVLHRTWQEHVDRLANALAELRDLGIPVIFRPYHEMNGKWFWWGGDAEWLKQLWALIFDRYVNHHNLTNLLWAWNPDKPHPGVEDFYPGHGTVDLLGTDIYPVKGLDETYPQEWYDRMAALAGGRPVALSENSQIPSPTDLDRMPWTYFMGWDNLTFAANTPEAISKTFADPRVIVDSVKL
ncbi:MAG: glycosyl hydrolase [Fimbriimonas sp.]